MSHTDRSRPLTPKSFPTERDVTEHSLSICIVTFEALGFWTNGGIATVSTGLAELLAATGHRVTLALTRSDALNGQEFEAAQQRYLAKGIEVVALSRAMVAPLEGPLEGFTSWERYAVYDWLRWRHFDIVHASEHLGETAYCIAARQLGVAFPNTQFWLGCHGASAWVIEANEEMARDVFWIWADAAERLVLRYSDLVWAPSNYLLDWMARKGYALPESRTYLQTYWMPEDLGEIVNRPAAPFGPVKELVFFGRLEPRKGIKLFLDAVLRLKDQLQGIAITFMGRASMIEGQPSKVYISAQMAGSGLSWQILDGLDRAGAYGYVTQPGRVAVLASPVDNSPCALYELLELGARFIACAGGGIPELLDPSCKSQVLFQYTVKSLTERLSALLRDGPPSPVPAPSLRRDACQAAWLSAHTMLSKEIVAAAAIRPQAFGAATVAIVYDGSVPALQVTFDALRWLGALVSDIVIVGADRRSVFPTDLPPGIRTMSLDEMSQHSVIAELAGIRPLLVLRSGATLTPQAMRRLLLAAASADAVVPFCFRQADGRPQIVEPALPGDLAWTELQGAAAVAGILSPKGLSALRDSQALPAGTNLLVWFDAAVLEGLSVFPLAQPLIDQSAVDRNAHVAADTRARMILCASHFRIGERVRFEIGCTSIARLR